MKLCPSPFLTISPNIDPFPHTVSHVKKFHPSPVGDILRYKLWPFNQNCQVTVFFKVMQYGYNLFQNVKPPLQNHIAKSSKYRGKFFTNFEQGSKQVLCNLF